MRLMSTPQSFCLWLLQVLLLAALLLFFLWLILRPSPPSYSIVDFSLPPTPTSTAASFTLEASNDNKLGGIIYGEMNVTLYSDGASVGNARLPPFYQRHERSTDVAGRVEAGRRVWEKVLRDGGKAELKLEVVNVVWYKIWRWRSCAHWLVLEAGVPVSGKKKMELHRSAFRI